jgi:hypothetical protein
MASPTNGGSSVSLKAQVPSVLVKRTQVAPVRNYLEYRPVLRRDFYHSCAYCTITECEAQAIRFTIDHYEPVVRAPALTNEYSNLMYCCDICNSYKGDVWPPAQAQANGYRFFRPDHDIYGEHFDRDGLRLKTKTTIGYFTSQTLNLDRLALKRVREARQRLSDCDRLVLEGIAALRDFSLDQLPQDLKGPAARAIRQMTSFAEGFAEGIDKVLREQARSPLLDIDPDAEEASLKRAANLMGMAGLYPGSWRARVSKTPSGPKTTRPAARKKKRK